MAGLSVLSSSLPQVIASSMNPPINNLSFINFILLPKFHLNHSCSSWPCVIVGFSRVKLHKQTKDTTNNILFSFIIIFKFQSPHHSHLYHSSIVKFTIFSTYPISIPSCHQQERIVMAGLSGGGWTTTLAAAVDPRIVPWPHFFPKGGKQL